LRNSVVGFGRDYIRRFGSSLGSGRSLLLREDSWNSQQKEKSRSARQVERWAHCALPSLIAQDRYSPTRLPLYRLYRGVKGICFEGKSNVPERYTVQKWFEFPSVFRISRACFTLKMATGFPAILERSLYFSSPLQRRGFSPFRGALRIWAPHGKKLHRTRGTGNRGNAVVAKAAWRRKMSAFDGM
jgi:hypothetical protein